MKWKQNKRSGLFLPPSVSGYSEAGASFQRAALKGFQPFSTAPNQDIDWNNRTLRQRSRALYMSTPIATSAIQTNRTKIVGVGLTLKSTPDREILGLSPEQVKAWQRKTEREFKLWADKPDCDSAGLNNFAELQQLAVMAWLMSGDVFALLQHESASLMQPYGLRLHLIEADRICTPADGSGYVPGVTDGKNMQTGNKIHDGVEVDGNGKIVAYHIRSTYPCQVTAEPVEWVRVKRIGQKTGLPNILHIMNCERPEQYRGVSYLAQSMETILQFRRYIDSSLMAAVVQAFFSAWIISQEGQNSTLFGRGEYIVDDTEQEVAPAQSVSEMDVDGPAAVFQLPAGTDVRFGSPNIPMAGFDAFVQTFCQLIGAGMGIPHDVLVKTYNSSYSASRAALMDAWNDFQMRRQWLINDFCQPVYEVWLSEAVARGRIQAPGFFDDPLRRAAWCGARWIGPVQSSLDPLKEANAAVIQIREALKTHEQVAREMGGGDWEENAEQLQRERQLLGGDSYDETHAVGSPES